MRISSSNPLGRRRVLRAAVARARAAGARAGAGADAAYP